MDKLIHKAQSFWAGVLALILARIHPGWPWLLLIVPATAPFWGEPCYAQSVGAQLPSPVQPYTRQVLPAIPAKPRPPEKIEMKAPQKLPPPDEADRTRLLSCLKLEGNTVYSGQELQYFYKDFLGTKVTLAGLYKIAGNIEQKYRSDGYLLTQVAVLEFNAEEESKDECIFQFRIVEGFIGATRIEGDAGKLSAKIEAYLANLVDVKPINQSQIERYLLLINDLPGVKAKSVLRPSRSQLGAADLYLRVERKPFDAAVVTNNRGSRFTGPWRGLLTGRANSVFGFGEGLETLLLRTLDSDEQYFGRLTYEQPILDEGLTLNLSMSYGTSRPGASLTLLDIRTEALYAGMLLKYPLIRSRRENFYLNLGFYASETKVDQLGQRFSNDHLRVVHGGGSYDFVDAWDGANSFNLDVRQGVQGLGASSNDNPERSRLEGKSDFTAIQGYATRYQSLFGSAFGVYLAATGQYAFSSLLSNEEFRIGGEQFGRGYDPSELSGDSGFATTIEIQYTVPTPFEIISFYQIYSFYDFGVVFNYDTGADRSASLMSNGLGLRAQLFDYFNIGLEIAFPLTRKVAAQNNNDPRLYLQVSARY